MSHYAAKKYSAKKYAAKKYAYAAKMGGTRRYKKYAAKKYSYAKSGGRHTMPPATEGYAKQMPNIN
jgi:hypothetical protein